MVGFSWVFQPRSSGVEPWWRPWTPMAWPLCTGWPRTTCRWVLGTWWFFQFRRWKKRGVKFWSENRSEHCEVIDVVFETQETPNFWRVQFEFLHSGEGTIGGESRSQQPGTGETVQQWWTALTLDHRHNCRTVRPWSLEKVLRFSLRHCQMVQFQPTLNLISFQAKASPMEIAKAHVPCANHRCFWCKWCRWDCTAIKPTAKMRCVSFYSEMATWGMWLYHYIPFSGKPHVECGVALLKAQDSRAREVMAVLAESLGRLEALSTHQGAELLQRLQVHEQTPASFFAASLEPQAGTFINSEHDFGTRIWWWLKWSCEFLFGCSSHPHLLLKETEWTSPFPPCCHGMAAMALPSCARRVELRSGQCECHLYRARPKGSSTQGPAGW